MNTIVWCVGGSDSSGAAGLQADLKTATALGVHACTVVTSITAQNAGAVRHVVPCDADIITAQLQTLADELKPQAIKIGMLGSKAAVDAVASFLESTSGWRIRPVVVCDPIVWSSSGAELASDEVLGQMQRVLFRYIDVLTPNIPEAERLLGRTLHGAADNEASARQLLSLGIKAVVIKGGHADGTLSQDYFTDGHQHAWLHGPRWPISARGTGCTFSTALAAASAWGQSPLDAAVVAKAYVSAAIHSAMPIGRGTAIMATPHWPVDSLHFPWATDSRHAARPQFTACDKIGFYPVVDSVAWMRRLLPLGVETMQLRIKHLQGAALADEICEAVSLARAHACQLFVNDHWQLAIEYGAYGVHLGQQDLRTADLDAIASRGLCLGISTHSYVEVARAHAVRPSYMAIGPIFRTTLKEMPYAPQGIDALRIWRSLLNSPLVAIGGLTLQHAHALRAAQVDGIAVVSDVTQHDDPEARVRAWLSVAGTKMN